MYIYKLYILNSPLVETSFNVLGRAQFRSWLVYVDMWWIGDDLICNNPRNGIFLVNVEHGQHCVLMIVEILWIWTPLWTLYTCGWVSTYKYFLFCLSSLSRARLFRWRHDICGSPGLQNAVHQLGWILLLLKMKVWCMVRTCDKNHHMSRIKLVPF